MMTNIDEDLVDKIARIIDPYAFGPSPKYELLIEKDHKESLRFIAQEKAKTILELLK